MEGAREKESSKVKERRGKKHKEKEERETGERRPCGFASSKFDNLEILSDPSHGPIPILESQTGRL